MFLRGRTSSSLTAKLHVGLHTGTRPGATAALIHFAYLDTESQGLQVTRAVTLRAAVFKVLTLTNKNEGHMREKKWHMTIPKWNHSFRSSHSNANYSSCFYCEDQDLIVTSPQMDSLAVGGMSWENHKEGSSSSEPKAAPLFTLSISRNGSSISQAKL